jgi:hypothetical protein
MFDRASKELFHPVLPYRSNNKLFCICRSCVFERNISRECKHLRDDERALTGTWVLDEFRLALGIVYKIHIYEVYEYQINQYSLETDEGGLLVDYINTFLQQKAEASGCPSWVRNPEDEERYIHSFRESEGIGVDKV